MGLAVIAGFVGQAAAQPPYQPSPVGATHMPDPIPCTGPTPNLAPGPISPSAAPPGPPDCLSLSRDHTSAFQCENFPQETACFFHFGMEGLLRQKLGKGFVAVSDFASQGLDTGNPPPLGPPVAQRFSDITPKMAYGFRATAGLLCGDNSLELTGFYLFNRQSSVDTFQQGLLDLPFSGTPLGFEGDNGMWLQADRVRTTVSTTLWDAEVNYRCCNPGYPGCELLCGVRYMEFKDGLRVYTGDDDLSFFDAFGQPDPHRQATYSVQTWNRILAPQLGVDLTWQPFCWLSLGAMGKGAWGVDFSDTKLSLTRGDGFTGFNVQRNNPTVLTQLYELNGYIEFNLTERCRIRGGYTALWLVGLPMSQDQFDFNLLNPSGRRDTHGSVFFHGPMAELQFLF
jgi:hypothetical protein